MVGTYVSATAMPPKHLPPRISMVELMVDLLVVSGPAGLQLGDPMKLAKSVKKAELMSTCKPWLTTAAVAGITLAVKVVGAGGAMMETTDTPRNGDWTWVSMFRMLVCLAAYGIVALVRDVKKVRAWTKSLAAVKTKPDEKIDMTKVTPQTETAEVFTQCDESRTTTTKLDLFGSVYCTQGGLKYHLQRQCHGLRLRVHPLKEYEACKLCGPDLPSSSDEVAGFRAYTRSHR